MERINYFSRLGVPDTASCEEVTRKYNELCKKLHPSMPFGSKRAFDEITEAYNMILLQLDRKDIEQETIQCALQRKSVVGKLTKALNIKGVKRIFAGLSATIMLFSASACSSQKDYLSDLKDGYILLYDGKEWVNDITETSDYYIINTENGLVLTKAVLEDDGSNMIYRYYRIDSKTNSRPLCFSIIPSSSRIKSAEETDISTALDDYNYFEGKYGNGHLIPHAAAISLMNFVASKQPSEADLMYWASNSQQAIEQYESLVMGEYRSTISKTFLQTDDEEKTEEKNCSFEFNVPIMLFKLESKDGTKQNICGYRGSMSSDDIGYNYLYNLFDGKIYYIGDNNENSFVKIEEEIVATPRSIRELREMYDINFQVESTYEERQPSKNGDDDDLSIEGDDQQEIDNQDGDSMKISEYDELDENAKKIKTYENILVVDLSIFPRNEHSTDNLPEGTKYLFLVPQNYETEYNLNYTNPFDTTSFVSLSKENFSHISYVSNETNLFSDFSKDAGACVLPINDFLENNGYAEFGKESFSLGELAQFNAVFNSLEEEKVRADDMMVLDLGNDYEVPEFVIVKKYTNGYEGYVSIIESTAFASVPTDSGEVFYYDSGADIDVRTQCVSLKDFLRMRFGKDYEIKDEYTDGELITLYESINGYGINKKDDEKRFVY